MPTQEEIDTLRGAPVLASSMIIGGKPWSAAESMLVISPLDGSSLTELSLAQQSDVDASVAAARKSKSLHAIDKFINHKTAWLEH